MKVKRIDNSTFDVEYITTRPPYDFKHVTLDYSVIMAWRKEYDESGYTVTRTIYGAKDFDEYVSIRCSMIFG